MMCRVLGVSPSGYYGWKSREPSERERRDDELKVHIAAIHERSRGTYGVPRVHAELQWEGERVSRKRVARLMQVLGLEGVSRRKGTRTTVRGRDARPAPDLVERDFTADRPDRLCQRRPEEGSRISPTARPGRASCSSRWYSMRTAAGWWDGRWLII